MGKILVITNRKGGCGKSFTTASLGVGLARQGKKVLCIDTDNQHSLTVSMGITEPKKLTVTQIIKVINEAYGEEIRIFKDSIPHSVRAAETSETGKSILLHDPHGKVAAAYDALAKGVLEIA